MTTVRPLSRAPLPWGAAAGWFFVALAQAMGGAVSASAQSPGAHWLHAGAMPPGAIGAQRLLRGGPLLGHTQPVQWRIPEGTTIAAATDGCSAGYGAESGGTLLVGVQAGPVYRFRVEGTPGFPGVAVYPTVELLDRTYPPPGKELDFPIPLELTLDDLRLAAEGALVTRVVYVEDPRTALPGGQNAGQSWRDVRAGEDPLVAADTLGRPVAIVRLGARDPLGSSDCRFAAAIELR